MSLGKLRARIWRRADPDKARCAPRAGRARAAEAAAARRLGKEGRLQIRHDCRTAGSIFDLCVMFIYLRF